MPCDILPNGVDVGQFAKADPWPSERPAILFIGRHEPRKGLSVVIDAFAGIDDAVLWIAGEGAETERLQAGVGANPRVEWLGTISEEEKARRLRGATLACFPSIEGESFGVVLLEAMAAGVPVVASDLTGYRDVARDDREAVLTPPGDVSSLRAALRSLLDDAPRRERLIASGRARAAGFAMDALAAAFIDRYRAAIRATPATTNLAS